MFFFGAIVTASLAGVFAKKLWTRRRQRQARGREEAAGKSRGDEFVELLKNALLTYALALLRRGDFAATSKRYDTYDGTQLPPLLGCSAEHACFNYIRPGARASVSNSSRRRQDAIDRYVQRNLSTPQQVSEFLSELLECSIFKIEVAPLG